MHSDGSLPEIDGLIHGQGTTHFAVRFQHEEPRVLPQRDLTAQRLRDAKHRLQPCRSRKRNSGLVSRQVMSTAAIECWVAYMCVIAPGQKLKGKRMCVSSSH